MISVFFLSSKYLAVDLGFESSINEVSSHGCGHGFGSSLEGLSTDVRAIIQMSPRDSLRCHRVSSVSNTKTRETDGGKETEHRTKQKSHHLSAALMLKLKTNTPAALSHSCRTTLRYRRGWGGDGPKGSRCEHRESGVTRGQLRG